MRIEEYFASTTEGQRRVSIEPKPGFEADPRVTRNVVVHVDGEKVLFCIEASEPDGHALAYERGEDGHLIAVNGELSVRRFVGRVRIERLTASAG